MNVNVPGTYHYNVYKEIIIFTNFIHFIANVKNVKGGETKKWKKEKYVPF